MAASSPTTDDCISMATRLLRAGPAALPPPPFPALAGCEAGSFAQATLTSRLPAILASLVADAEAELLPKHAGDEVALAQVRAGLGEVRALREAMMADAELAPLAAPGAPALTQELLDAANACVQLAAERLRSDPACAGAASSGAGARGQGPDGDGRASGQPQQQARPSWLGLPWLLCECYMYAALHAAQQRQPALASYDPFGGQKAAAWAKSAGAAAELAAETALLLETLHQQQQHPSAVHRPGGAAAASHPGQAKLDGHEDPGREEGVARAAVLAALHMSLWGNKADLSLLVSAAGLDAAGLSSSVERAAAAAASAAAHAGSAGAEAEAAPPRVIVDDSEAVWEVISGLRRRRAGAGSGGGGDSGPDGGVVVDLVLDNSGLELFADLCLADVLLEAGVADHIVLHGKPIPWFVSDTLAHDLELLLASCEAAEAPSAEVPAGAWQPVRRLAARWRAHLRAGRWAWAAHPFWCSPAPMCWMAAAAPELHSQLARSGLVILKGDLNYRKLTHDCRWPHTTPFRTALQGFQPAPLLALRTCKADVVAGLAPGLSARLDAADPDWLVNGKWGMIQAAL